MEDKCTCSSSFQGGVCQWCIEQYDKVYNKKKDECLFERVQRGEATHLVCTCPKCSPRC